MYNKIEVSNVYCWLLLDNKIHEYYETNESLYSNINVITGVKQW